VLKGPSRFLRQRGGLAEYGVDFFANFFPVGLPSADVEVILTV